MKNESFFMVYLDNGNTPGYKHSTLEEAEQEAKRLSKKYGSKAFVLSSVRSLEMDEEKLALALNKIVHEECKEVPHDIGWRLMVEVTKHISEQNVIEGTLSKFLDFVLKGTDWKENFAKKSFEREEVKAVVTLSQDICCLRRTSLKRTSGELDKIFLTLSINGVTPEQFNALLANTDEVIRRVNGAIDGIKWEELAGCDDNNSLNI